MRNGDIYYSSGAVAALLVSARWSLSDLADFNTTLLALHQVLIPATDCPWNYK